MLRNHPEQAKAFDEALAETRVKLAAVAQQPDEKRAPRVTLSRGSEGISNPEAPATPADPPSIRRDYTVRQEGDVRLYYRREDEQLAIRADATHIHGQLRDGPTIRAMLDLAYARGWSDVQVRGDLEMARETWIEATARGMKVEGYVPNREDRNLAEQRRLERGQEIEPERSEPPRQQQELPKQQMHL
ncbi:MAG: hypothetical protein INR62_10365 [Rhodospirillales bacterium]|nr:hypothetical protein [Acetobacter sp.]